MIRKTKTHDEYLNDIYRLNIDVVPLQLYRGSSTKILHKCKCGTQWMIRPNGVLIGQHCQTCSKSSEKKIDFYKSKFIGDDKYKCRLIQKNIKHQPIQGYRGCGYKILHKFNPCGCIGLISPQKILIGQGCGRCKGLRISKALTKTNDDYLIDLAKKKIKYIPIDKYINDATAIIHKCPTCMRQWMTSPSDIKQGYGCGNCQMSKGQIAISQWLEQHGMKFDIQKTFSDCKRIRCLKFDFFLITDSNIKIAIQFDGIQHFQPRIFKTLKNLNNEQLYKIKKKSIQEFKIVKINDNIKNEYCNNNDIKLLRIRYSDNIEETLLRFFKESNLSYNIV